MLSARTAVPVNSRAVAAHSDTNVFRIFGILSSSRDGNTQTSPETRNGTVRLLSSWRHAGGSTAGRILIQAPESSQYQERERTSRRRICLARLPFRNASSPRASLRARGVILVTSQARRLARGLGWAPPPQRGRGTARPAPQRKSPPKPSHPPNPPPPHHPLPLPPPPTHP